MVDGGQGVVLGKDVAAGVGIQLRGGADAAADGPARKDLGLHGVRAVQAPMLAHNLPQRKPAW